MNSSTSPVPCRPAIALRKEAAGFPESLRELRTEESVRQVLIDFNRRVREDRLRPGQGQLPRILAPTVDVDALVSGAMTDAQKVELYTASRIAIEPNTRAERGYLDMLAGRLKLPDALVDHIEATVASAKV